MNELSLIQTIAIWTLPVIFAITLHEVAHGWMANKLGDPTAKMLGRLTLNPLKHIDPIGTVVVPLVLLILGGFVFGWAKAVPVTMQNFKRPRKDMAWVAIAGPSANLLMAIGWAIVMKLGESLQYSLPEIGVFMAYTGMAGISINLILLVLNLIPIPPLDGSRVLSAFLSPKLAWQYNRLEPYGFFILLGLLFFGVLTPLLLGPYNLLKDLIFNIVGL
ncbi:site-2 protease family protein [Thiomicrorhabdus heinhorstiae]|uniref:Site-2 protease family protein n=1 Tax=Thiomicrorhabdus heinhorstiae TaxID=2748010 RepID=A0ABS0BUX1_9GAMM|nr:site-2 protease family protein [Thiomicrorhabdus heinhorstiae]MBF6056870.1 site-2 protease family protein [Thiomicrorhabdus heinhorstiae]